MNPKKRRRNGVFCLESEWYNDLRKPTSIEGALTLLKTARVSDIPYIHRNVATRKELEHYLSKWAQKGLDAFPLLYLGLHGKRGALYLGDGRSSSSWIELPALTSIIRSGNLAKRKRIVHFGSCGTLSLHGNAVQRFLRDTGLFAVFGYEKNVSWMEAAIFEIALLYNVLDSKSFTEKRIRSAVARTKAATGKLSKSLGFRYFVRKSAASNSTRRGHRTRGPTPRHVLRPA